MTKLATCFDFDDADLNANRRHQLSQRQMRLRDSRVREPKRDSFLIRYNYMLATFGVGSLLVAGIVVYAVHIRQQWLAYVILFVVSVAVIASFILALLDDKPRSARKPKFKNQYHPVQRIQGTIQLYTEEHKDGVVNYEVRINYDRTFTLTRDQWQCLEDGAAYIFYHANGRILSLEPVSSEISQLMATPDTVT